MIRRVKTVTIPVANADRASDFYTTKLGFSIMTDQPFGDDQRWIELKIPGAETRLVLFSGPSQKANVGGFLNFVLESDDIETTYEILKGKGVAIESPPKKEHWGSMFILKDSESNTICVSEKR